MRQVWVVLRREYLERVKTKGFILSTIAIPVLMVGMIGLSAFLGIQSERSERELALIDYTGLIGAEGRPAVGETGLVSLAQMARYRRLEVRHLGEDLLETFARLA